ncbi:dipeptide/oligopeptide/nickel ABC transporter, ATP-binding protein [Campylobacter ureolyticus RIGS 9880]|uniref:Dipeptide/oligopeptide/nickel ABC transporter, ATP-binding protein n=1 Tax=Campylobacter ureolyticus RIGS 9880 TaxID=1032069 RepID=A0AAU8U6N1_9BACT|nr:ATP-binding cassette domain-containing protein [Campylobacter ureolyticus]AKT90317.1 dipeptide/oligopeptide/nickel ABC transporter, ATP-binding protein [Campylobacter ureolyticus RIGS 9880]
MLEVKNVDKFYDFKEHINKKTEKIQVLYDINFSLEDGDNLAILGVSGSGKSTLANLLSAVEKPTNGEILLNEENKNLNKKISLIMQTQKLCLNPILRIKTSINLLKKYLHLKFSDNDVKNLFETLNLNQEILQKFPHEISGGEASRIGILKALLIKPDILICDEITAGLDEENKNSVLNVLKKLKQSIIFITHDLEAAKEISKNILILEKGKTLFFGKFSELQNNEILDKFSQD